MVLAVVSCALFFLEPIPGGHAVTDYVILTGLSIWMIYTLDHLIDGYLHKHEEIYLYNFHYKGRFIFPVVLILIAVVMFCLVYRNWGSRFVYNGLWLSIMLPVYFLMKFNLMFRPLVKMAFISVIMSTSLVSLFFDDNILTGFLSPERIVMTLLVFNNQLVQYGTECDKNGKDRPREGPASYQHLAVQSCFWILIILIFSTFFNIYSWPFTSTLALITIFLFLNMRGKLPPIFRNYSRFWADFIFAMAWPVLKLLLLI